MEDLDLFNNQTFEESKRFLEKAKKEESDEGIQAYLKASIILSHSFLEGQINSITSDFEGSGHLSMLEQSVFFEKEVVLKKGKFQLGSTKFYRTDERIEFLIKKFKPQLDFKSETWWTRLKSQIKIRNSLVHPRKNVRLKTADCERSLECCLEAVNRVYLAVYNMSFPYASMNYDSSLEF